MKYYSFLFVWIFCFCSCREKKELNSSDLPVIYVDLSGSDRKLDLAPYLSDDWELVSLNEEKENLLIRRISKVMYEDGVYYIYDNSNIIYLVNKEGNLVNVLNRVGNGPGEYYRIYNMYVEGGNLWICDSEKRSIYQYDKALNFIKKDSTAVFPMDLLVDRDNLILSSDIFPFFAKQAFGLDIYNFTTHQHSLHIPIPECDIKYIIKVNSRQLTKNREMVLVRYNYNDTIYRVREGQVFPEYIYQFSERFADVPVLQDAAKNGTNPDLIRGIDNLYCTDKSILFQFKDRKAKKTAVYDIKNRSTQVYNGFIHSALGDLEIAPSIITPDYMICVLTPEMVLNEPIVDREGIKDPRFRREYETLINRLDEEDNPILLKFHFRSDSKL